MINNFRSLTFILLVSLFSADAYATWFPQQNACDESFCGLRHTNGTVIWHIPDVSQVSWNEAESICSAKNMRLATYSEMNEGYRHFIIRANFDWPNFGDASWFFWYENSGLGYSFSNENINPIAGLQRARVVCVRDGGPVPQLPPIAEQMAGIGDQAITNGNEFEREMNQSGGEFPGMTTPGVVGSVGDDGRGTLVFLEAPPYKDQREASRQNSNSGPSQPDVSRPSCSGWDKCLGSSYNRGNNTFGAEMSYQLRGRNNGETANSAGISTTVFGMKRDVVDLSTRGYHDGNYYRLEATSRILNQSYNLYSYSLERGDTHVFPKEIFIRKTFFKKSWVFVIGVVPVTVTALVRGEAGRDESRWGYLVYDSDQFTRVYGDYNLYSGIWGALQGGPGVPGVTAGVGGAVEFISGTVSLLGNAGFSAADGRGNICFQAVLKNMKTMSGEAYLFLEYPELQIQEVTRMVDGICSRVGGWLGKKVCEPARRVTERVERVINVYKHKVFYKLPGRVLHDNHYWYNDCAF